MTGAPMGRGLSRNLSVNVLGLVAPMAVSFVTVPLYIHAIGAARYGVVTLTWILLGYLGVLDFGLSARRPTLSAGSITPPRASVARCWSPRSISISCSV